MSVDEGNNRPSQPVGDMVVLFNAVAAGIGGLYVSTRSIAVTGLAVGLVIVLCLVVPRFRR
ncbi:hypothetical protein ACNF49_30740 [Actinomadura sp. ATCC 39365]|uniref:hypothetical protein n=1 Tax=Nonomuraea sp. NPDC005692 TaxID=3157168 RepID=UPI00340B09CB